MRIVLVGTNKALYRAGPPAPQPRGARRVCGALCCLCVVLLKKGARAPRPASALAQGPLLSVLQDHNLYFCGVQSAKHDENPRTAARRSVSGVGGYPGMHGNVSNMCNNHRSWSSKREPMRNYLCVRTCNCLQGKSSDGALRNTHNVGDDNRRGVLLQVARRDDVVHPQRNLRELEREKYPQDNLEPMQRSGRWWHSQRGRHSGRGTGGGRGH